MFCKKCGAPITDGSKFCTDCGAQVQSLEEPVFEAPVEQAAEVPTEVYAEQAVETPAEAPAVAVTEAFVVETPAPVEVDFNTEEDNEPFVKPKKKKAFAKLICAVLAVAVLIGAAFFVFKDRMMGIVMNIMPAEKQLKYTYSRLAENMSNNFAEKYGVGLEKIGKPYSGEMTLDVEVTEDLLSNLNVNEELDINKASLVYSIDAEGTDRVGVDLGIKVQDTTLANVQVYMDLAEQELVLAVPGLIPDAVKLDLSEEFDSEDLEQFKAYQEFMSEENIKKILPKQDLVKTILPAVVKAALAEVEEVQKGKSKFEAGGIEQNAKCLEIEITSEVLAKMAIGAMEEIKENQDVKEYIETLAGALDEQKDLLDLGSYDVNDMYDDMVDGLDELIDTLEDVDDNDELFTLTTWVNGKFDIIAVEVEVPDEAKVFMGMANDKKNFGYEFSVEVEEEIAFLIEGQTELEKDKLSGSFDFRYYDEHIATVEVKDLDALKLREGFVNGKVIVSFGQEISDAIEESLGVRSVVLVLNIQSDKQSFSVTTEASADGKKMLTLALGVKTSEDGKVEIPSTSTNDVEEWAQKIDIEELLDRLSKIGITEDMISSLVEDAMGSYDDYGDLTIADDIYGLEDFSADDIYSIYS